MTTPPKTAAEIAAENALPGRFKAAPAPVHATVATASEKPATTKPTTAATKPKPIFDSSGKTPQPGAQRETPKPVAKPAESKPVPQPPAAVAAPKTSTAPAATKPAAAAPKVVQPTTVSVPVATLKAMHAQLMAHASAVASYIPTDPSDPATLAQQTADRLKAQTVAK